MTTELLSHEKLASPQYTSGPQVRVLELISMDLNMYGEVQEETKSRGLDEELTWVAELVAQETEYAVIPRTYQRLDADFVDVHGVSVGGVLWSGIDSIKESVEAGEVGAVKEQTRRFHEIRNFQRQIDMPKRSYMVEMSLTDGTWSEAERQKWGYSGDTLVRITFIDDYGDVKQANICLPISDSKFALAILKEFSLNGDSGAESLLANPYMDTYSGNFEHLVKRIEGRVSHAQRRAHPMLSLIGSVKKIRQEKKDAWGLVSSNQVLNDELWAEFENLARTQPIEKWESMIEQVRRGFWKLSTEKADTKLGSNSSDSIGGAAIRSNNDGDTFIACGGSSESGKQDANLDGTTYLSRLMIVATLAERKGMGNCGGCKDFADLYGCGNSGTFCRSCNDVWCKQYLATGKMLEGKDIVETKFRKYIGRYTLKV